MIDVQEVLDRVECRGWDIYAFETESEMYRIKISISRKVIDVLNGEITMQATVVAISTDARIGSLETEVVQMVRGAMHAMAVHEVDEWFKLDGKRIFNPHGGGECRK